MSTVTCPSLVNPTDGTVTMSGNIEGSTATYNCNTGFGVNGAEMVTCTSDGSWSADPPTCDCELMVTVLNPLLVSVCVCVCAAVCPGLSVDNGMVMYSPSGPLFENTVATYTCTSGYTLMGDMTRTCGSNMMWNGNDPTCERECFVCVTVRAENFAVIKFRVLFSTLKF